MVARPVAPDGAAPRRDSRRAEILDAFTRGVAERGYDGTNFGDLALELGISKGTIVHHFGTKAAMLRELHEGYMRRRLAEVRVVWERLSRRAQLEAVLLSSPDVADAAVIGVYDERSASCKRVRQLVFIDAVPKSASGKILRLELRQQEKG